MSQTISTHTLPFSLSTTSRVAQDTTEANVYWISGVDSSNDMKRVNLISGDVTYDNTIDYSNITSLSFRQGVLDNTLYVGDSTLNLTNSTRFGIYTATSNDLTHQPSIKFTLDSFSQTTLANSISSDLVIVDEKFVSIHQWFFLFENTLYQFKENAATLNENNPLLTQWVGRYLVNTKSSLAVDWRGRKIYVSRDTEIMQYDFSLKPLGLVSLPNNTNTIAQLVFDVFENNLLIFFESSSTVVRQNPVIRSQQVNSIIAVPEKERTSVLLDLDNTITTTSYSQELSHASGSLTQFSFLHSIDLTLLKENSNSTSSLTSTRNLFSDNSLFWSPSNASDYLLIDLERLEEITLVEIDYETANNTTLQLLSSGIDQVYQERVYHSFNTEGRSKKVWGLFNNSPSFSCRYLKLIAQSGLTIHKLSLYRFGSLLNSEWSRTLEETLTKSLDCTMLLNAKVGNYSDQTLSLSLQSLENFTTPVLLESLDLTNYLLPSSVLDKTKILVFEDGLVATDYSIIDNTLVFNTTRAKPIHLSYVLETTTSPDTTRVQSLANLDSDKITYQADSTEELSRPHLVFINGKLGRWISASNLIPEGVFYQCGVELLDSTVLIVDSSGLVSTTNYVVANDLLQLSSALNSAYLAGCVKSNTSYQFKSGLSLVGTKNSINKVFILPEIPVTDTELIWHNSELLIRNTHYTITSNVIQLLNSAPGVSDTLIGAYSVNSNTPTKMLTNIALVQTSGNNYKIPLPLKMSEIYPNSEFVLDQNKLLIRGIDYTIDNSGIYTEISFTPTTVNSLSSPIINYQVSNQTSTKFVTSLPLTQATRQANLYTTTQELVRLLYKASTAPEVVLVSTLSSANVERVYNHFPVKLSSVNGSLLEFSLSVNQSNNFLLWRNGTLLTSEKYTRRDSHLLLEDPLSSTEELWISYSSTVPQTRASDLTMCLVPVGEHGNTDLTFLMRVLGGSIFGHTNHVGRLDAQYRVGDVEGVEKIKITNSSTGYDLLNIESSTRELCSLTEIDLTTTQKNAHTLEFKLGIPSVPRAPTSLVYQNKTSQVLLDWSPVVSVSCRSTFLEKQNDRVYLGLENGKVVIVDHSQEPISIQTVDFSDNSIVGVNDARDTYLSCRGVLYKNQVFTELDLLVKAFLTLNNLDLLVLENGEIRQLNSDLTTNILSSVDTPQGVSRVNSSTILVWSDYRAYRIVSDGTTITQHTILTSTHRLTSVCENSNGDIIYCDRLGGVIYQNNRRQISEFSLASCIASTSGWRVCDENNKVFILDSNLVVLSTHDLPFVASQSYSINDQYWYQCDSLLVQEKGKEYDLHKRLRNPYIRGYLVERKTHTTNWTRLPGVQVITNYIDTQVDTDSMYSYRVRAIDEFDQVSRPSGVIQVDRSIKRFLTDCKITNIHTNYGIRNTIHWTPLENTEKAIGYRVLRKYQSSPDVKRLYSTAQVPGNFLYSTNLRVEDNSCLNDSFYSNSSESDKWLKWTPGRAGTLQVKNNTLKKTDSDYGEWTSDVLTAVKLLPSTIQLFEFVRWVGATSTTNIPAGATLRISYQGSYNEETWSEYRDISLLKNETMPYIKLRVEMTGVDSPSLTEITIKYSIENKLTNTIETRSFSLDSNYFVTDPLRVGASFTESKELDSVIVTYHQSKLNKITSPYSISVEVWTGTSWLEKSSIRVESSEGTNHVRVPINDRAEHVRVNFFPQDTNQVWLGELEFIRMLPFNHSYKTSYSDSEVDWSLYHYAHYQVIAYETGNSIS